MPSMGKRLKIPLTAMGSREVTDIFTGRRIHQVTIHSMVPSAAAPWKVKKPCRNNKVSKNIDGPAATARKWYLRLRFLPYIQIAPSCLKIIFIVELSYKKVKYYFSLIKIKKSYFKGALWILIFIVILLPLPKQVI